MLFACAGLRAFELRDHGNLLGEPDQAQDHVTSLIPTNGATTPPTPYTRSDRRRSAAAPSGRYRTPRSARGMRATMMSALKITAERIALSGEARRITSRGAI